MYKPLVERQRFEDVGDVGRMQPVELALELRLVLLGDETLDDLAATLVVAYRRVLQLLVDESFDQPVPAQQRGDFGERVLHAFARFGALVFLGFDGFGHGWLDKDSDASRRILTLLRIVSPPSPGTARGRGILTAHYGTLRPRHAREDDPDLPVQPRRALDCARRSADWAPSPPAAPPVPPTAARRRRRSNGVPRPRRRTRHCPIR